MSTPRLDSTITARFTLAGLHHWPGAHDARAYLRDLHRHLFHVQLTAGVTHDERDIEWHDLTELAEKRFRGMADSFHDGLLNYGARSCETLARQLFEAVHDAVPTLLEVRVGEDGEFQATVRARV